jgi:hypothetical protein
VIVVPQFDPVKMYQYHHKLRSERWLIGDLPLPDHITYPPKEEPIGILRFPQQYNSDQYAIGLTAVGRLIGRSGEYVRKKMLDHPGLPHMRVGFPNTVLVVDKNQFLVWARKNKIGGI